jgi:hypothetical protein
MGGAKNGKPAMNFKKFHGLSGFMFLAEETFSSREEILK